MKSNAEGKPEQRYRLKGQGTVLAEWTATAADGQPRGHGTSVFVFGSDGRISSVVGFWS